MNRTAPGQAGGHHAGLQVTCVLPPKAWSCRLRSPPPWADPTKQPEMAGPTCSHRATTRRLPGKGNQALTQAPALGGQAALALTQGPWQGHHTSPSHESRGPTQGHLLWRTDGPLTLLQCGSPHLSGSTGQAPGSQPLLGQVCSHRTNSRNPAWRAACPSLRAHLGACVSASPCE